MHKLTKKEIRNKFFPTFTKYLEKKGIDPDDFPIEIWMSKIWEFHYEGYLTESKNNETHERIISLTPTEILKQELKKREDILEKAKKEKEQTEKKEKESNIKLVDKDGKDLKKEE